jgi:DNA (cytosine-5)-methyltransferase 1
MDGWRLVDLFCGVGGFRLGLEGLGARTVYSCDNDETARKWYARFFGAPPEGADIRQVERLPEHDILCAGFPCVAFSRAGQKRGRDDDRGRLFDEVVRLVAASPPQRAILLENVPRILTAEGGAMHRHICRSLGELGFDVHHRILNAGHHGVPQQRRRCFYVCLRRPVRRPFVWPAPQPASCPVLEDILLPEPKLIERGDITCAEVPKAGDAVQRRYPRPEAAAAHYSRAQQMGYIGRNLQGQRLYHRRGLAPTLETWHPVRVWQDRHTVRILQPREFARLMGFPDRLPAPPTEEEANKVYGNSVPVPVVRQLGICVAAACEAPPLSPPAAPPAATPASPLSQWLRTYQ